MGAVADQVPGDMGILLAFMSIWNMIGAIVLIPALSHFLLPFGSQERVRRRSKHGSAAHSDEDDRLARADYGRHSARALSVASDAASTQNDPALVEVNDRV